MANLLLLKTIVPSEYLIISAVIMMLADFFYSVFHLFIKSDAMYNNQGPRFAANVLVVLFEVAFILCAIIILSNDSWAVELAIPIICVAAVFTLMLLWFFIQSDGLAQLSTQVLETMVGVIEAGDENLDGHSLHVQNLTMLIYDYLPFFKRKSINPMNLQYASLLLDIGKLGIPRRIIDKKGKLSPQERELIQQHPEICVAIFEKLPSFTTVTNWIKYHHERVDGNGYYHVKGKDIPLASRLLAVADTYSAITMDRSYRPSLSYENAISELRLVAGTQLDENLVEVFCSIPKSKITACMNDVRDRMKKYQSGDFRW